MAVKACWWCKNFVFETGGSTYSEDTPGYNFKMKCKSNGYEFDGNGDNIEDFKRCLDRAVDCDYFILENEVKEMQKIVPPTPRTIEERVRDVEIIVKDIIDNKLFNKTE